MFARILLAVFAAALPLRGTAQSGSIAQRPGTSIAVLDQGADRFVAGRSIRIVQPVAGDLIAAGGKVDVDAAVNGDAVIAGGDVRVSGALSNSLYCGGGQVTLAGTVGRNARIGGGRAEIGRDAMIAGNLSIAGGEVRIDGAVKGYVQAAGGRVFIDGPVGGDVVATSGAVELGPNARIAGRLRYASRNELKRDPAAQVAGGVERTPIDRSTGHARRTAARAAGWAWTVGLVFVAVVLVAALPAFTARVAATLHTRAGMSLLLGFVAMVCIPVAAVLLVFTLIGIPLALLALVLYVALLLVGYAMTGIGIGDWLLGRYRVADASRVGWRIGAAALAMLAIALLARLPWIGALVSFVVLMAGFGAVLLQARANRAASRP